MSGTSPELGHRDVYEIVTDKIVALLEQGTIPWHRPWKGARNLVTNREYRGVNALILNCAEFASPYWLTLREANALGGRIKRGERSTLVVFWRWTEATRTDEETGEEKAERRAVLKYYLVFNLEQCEGVRVPKYATNPTPAPALDAQRIVDGMPDPPAVRHGGGAAYYRPAEDLVCVPASESFESVELYFDTLFHELVHSTGHGKRLGRDLERRAPFGSTAYGREELIAEMGAAFLCGKAGIDQRTVNDSAGYIQGWLECLHDDRRVVVLAASAAQKAADFILGQGCDVEAA